MKRLLTVLFALMLALALVPAAYADETPEGERALFTVVGIRFDSDNKAAELALSCKELHYSESEGREIYYYTTTNVTVYPASETSVMLLSDGTERGNALLESLSAFKDIPLGAVVEVTWSGMIAETYPPQLEGISAICFTGADTDYTDEEIEAERSAMNEMRSDGIKYPEPTAEEPEPAPEEPEPAPEEPDPTDTNPKTGASEIVALVGVLAWGACVVAGKGR